MTVFGSSRPAVTLDEYNCPVITLTSEQTKMSKSYKIMDTSSACEPTKSHLPSFAAFQFEKTSFSSRKATKFNTICYFSHHQEPNLNRIKVLPSGHEKPKHRQMPALVFIMVSYRDTWRIFWYFTTNFSKSCEKTC